MNKFDINSAKFLSIIIGICVVFILLIAHAYNYIPKNDIKTDLEVLAPQEELEIKNEEKQTKNTNIDINNNNATRAVSTTHTLSNDNKLETINDEELIANNGIILNDETSINTLLENAKTLKINSNFAESIVEYQKIIKLTDDNQIKANCYEEIALILAQMKRYGSALAAIQKGYNLYPNTSRELLLARLYYKTGEVDKATERINNILRRDFIQE